ncbi:hypothetical protein KPL78_23645 [Roseomonas sp. HJA6]|uniref:Uncharacterized protein n=1 Tax=Roseomonas alba TaxID=2846776 RepID=A0ABS7AEZ2_9PROT|nr:hypothetical protein [Neoroseomonas alba]MBW6400874.1 hypothetical protein [Neoroseomonas alba]
MLDNSPTGMNGGAPLTRRELYDLVWAKPMMHVAAQFGVTGTGLAKICERYAIPTPPRGYWAKLQHGKKVKQEPFVEVEDPRLQTLEIHAGAWRLPDEVREVIQYAKARQAERQRPPPAPREKSPEADVAPAPPWPVADVHPLLRRTAQALRKGKPNADGAIQANGEGMAGVAVGKDAVERSIYILDALIRSLVERGLPPTMAGDGMRVERGKDSASIAMSERIRREKHVPTPEELAAEERRKKRLERYYATRRTWDAPSSSDLYAQAYPAIDTIRTGELVVQIQGWGDGVRRTWADGRTQRLDRMVEDVATGLEAILAARRLQREEREERERRYQERARRHALARQRAEREKKREAFLDRLMELRREVDALEAWLALTGPTSALVGSHARLIGWVTARLETISRRLEPDQISAALDAEKLFPEPDELHDPLGDPNEPLGW